MNDNLRVDFYGYDFKVDFPLLITEFEQYPGVYVVYTEKVVLDLGVTENLKDSIETHINTHKWFELSKGDSIFVAFYFEVDIEVRIEIENYLRPKMKPLCGTL